MKAALQFDPSLDVVINRLPHAFVRRASAVRARRQPRSGRRPASAGPRADRRPVGTEAGRPAAAEPPTEGRHRGDPPAGAGLGPTGALVIFPEGGNFTPVAVAARASARLEESRRYEEARRARSMANLLPPRSGGAFAAIDSAPTADVIFVAHTGLDDLITVGRRLAGPADGAGHQGQVVAGAGRPRCRASGTRSCAGCTTGGSASTRGSPRIVRSGPRSLRPLRATRRCGDLGAGSRGISEVSACRPRFARYPRARVAR